MYMAKTPPTLTPSRAKLREPRQKLTAVDQAEVDGK